MENEKEPRLNKEINLIEHPKEFLILKIRNLKGLLTKKNDKLDICPAIMKHDASRMRLMESKIRFLEKGKKSKRVYNQLDIKKSANRSI